MAYDEKTRVATKFNEQITGLIKIAEQISDNRDMFTRIKRYSRLVMNNAPTTFIELSKNNLWAMREQIIARNDKYFAEGNFSHMISDLDNYEFIEDVICELQDEYPKLSSFERDIIWGRIQKLLQLAIEYKVLINDYVG